MSDRIFLPILALAALGMIVLASVWPQGYGARSPGPFGSIPIQQTPAMRAAMAREQETIREKQQGARSPAAEAGLRSGQ